MRFPVKKTLFILFFLVMSLIIVEIGLRASGYIYYSMRVAKKLPRCSKGYTIVCFGDSNTFGIGVKYGEDYLA